MAFRRRKREEPSLGREGALNAKPVLHRLVKVERSDEGTVILQIPRRQSAMVRAISQWFHIPPYKQVALDELGTFVIELCDGRHTVSEIVEKFSKRFRLSHREAEASMTAFLRTLAKRSVIGTVIAEED
ncbi:MAG: PqqD family protein [Planctomycetota bacterium]|jgi:hypothetical protein